MDGSRICAGEDCLAGPDMAKGWRGCLDKRFVEEIQHDERWQRGPGVGENVA